MHKDLELSDKPTFKQLQTATRIAISTLKCRHQSGHSFEAWIQNYIEVHCLSPKTAKAYRSILSHFSLNDEQNSEVLRNVILRGKNCCQIIRTVNCFFKWLIQNQVQILNPAANIRMPQSLPRSRTLTRQEIRKLYRELEESDLNLQVFVRLLLETGARVSSISALKVGDLKSNGLCLKNIKTRRNYRLKTLLSPSTRALCETLVNGKPPSADFFSTCPQTLIYRVRRLLDRLFNQSPSEERIVIHSLRHTAATVALQSGIPLETVSCMLDHANINTTYCIYAKLSQKQLNQGFSTLFSTLHDNNDDSGHR
ncbi:MAG: tyrosine-type recombinase/integrase [Proteobacteria bacterium]|nr:tyrosine-type recombinase/integrase [Pseudomonadota bacterium]